MVDVIKVWLKGIIQSHAGLTMMVARSYSTYCGLLALRHRAKLFGQCYVDRSVRIIGWHCVSLGRNVVIGAGGWLNVNNRRVGRKTLQIGDNSFIGRNNFFTVGESIVLREYCLTASNCSFIGSSHNIADPFSPYISTGTTSTYKIYVGVNCFLGYGAMVIGNVRIGHGSIVGAGSVVRGDVPPFSIVVGNPARVIKCFDFSRAQWVPVDELVNTHVLNEDDYLSALRGRLKYPVQPISAAASGWADM